jgi:8-oxo-dGTP pyrophosphatase MutT (NUDIX family)
MIYWARPVRGEVRLAAEEHHDIRWVPAAELEHLDPPPSEAVKWYARQALADVGRGAPSASRPSPGPAR